MDEAAREDVAQRVLALAGGACEAIVADSDVGLTRFTHNAIHQNLAERNTSVRLRTITGGRTGVAATNDLSDAGLRAVVARAHAIAALAPHDPNTPPLVGNPRMSAPPEAFDPAVASVTPEGRAEMAADVFRIAEAGCVHGRV